MTMSLVMESIIYESFGAINSLSLMFIMCAAMILKSRMGLAHFHQPRTLNGVLPQYWGNFSTPCQLRTQSLPVRFFNKTQAAASTSVKSFIDHYKVFQCRDEDVDIPFARVHEVVWQNIDQWWSSTALVCARTGKSYTYGELRKLCGRFATSLRNNQWLPGTVVAVILPNVPEYAIITLGASEAGIALTLMNPFYTASELQKQLENSEAQAVITDATTYPTILESMKLGDPPSSLPVIIVADGNDVPPGTVNFRDLVADDVEEFGKTGERLNVNAEETMILPYSSGTTGLPKGVELTHRNIVAAISIASHPEYSLVKQTHNGIQDCVPLFLPLYHIYGMSICLLTALSMGVKLICMPKFTSTDFLEVLEKNRITAIYAVPPIIQLMTNEEKFTKSHLKYLKRIGSGAAPLTHEFMLKFRAKMGDHFALLQGYGLTETSSVTTVEKDVTMYSSGFILPNTKIRVVDRGINGDRNLGVNETGEIYIKGPQIMKGYLKNPEATRNTMDGEWLKTGDLGYVNDEGLLFITGRSKELIKVQGNQVSPTELENIIHGHDKVADAAVVGVPHEKYGEVPKAFVVPKDGVTITEEEIKVFVAQQVIKYKRLAHVVITDEIERSPAGKILRKVLQKL